MITLRSDVLMLKSWAAGCIVWQVGCRNRLMAVSTGFSVQSGPCLKGERSDGAKTVEKTGQLGFALNRYSS